LKLCLGLSKSSATVMSTLCLPATYSQNKKNK
jgi:hypothetical protein